MEACMVKASCRPEDFPSVEKQLHQWEDVESVGSLREKKNNKNDVTTVFITFRDEAAAKASGEKLSTIEGIIVREKKEGSSKPRESKRNKKRGKDLSAEFLKMEISDNRTTSAHPEGGEAQRGGRRGRGRGHQGGGRGRGGRQGGRQGGRGRGRSQGRGQGQNQRLPPSEVHVAVADNVPFGTTNMHLMDLFAPYGHVLDINRLELMVMVCYDNPESVQQCIHQLNGTKINDNTITVSSGTVMIPGHVAAQLGL